MRALLRWDGPSNYNFRALQADATSPPLATTICDAVTINSPCDGSATLDTMSSLVNSTFH